MTDDEEATEGRAAQAFDVLRAEVSLMRHAIERLTAEHSADSQMPDYSQTLGVISQNLSATAQRVDALVHSPALSLTPEETGRQIEAASFAARREDHRLFAAAKQGLDEVATRLRHQLESHIEAGAQRRRLWRMGLAGVGAGMALWAILAGPVTRSLPTAWLLPEQMAARSLRMPMWEGGQRLMRASNPQAFADIVASNRLVTANRKTLDACRARASNLNKTVRCQIEIGAGTRGRR